MDQLDWLRKNPQVGWTGQKSGNCPAATAFTAAITLLNALIG